MPKHLILVGACYLDTVLRFPEEDSKLRATSISTRRGGNCPNSLEVLQQLILPGDDLTTHLISCLPSRGSVATKRITESLNPSGGRHHNASRPATNLEHCIYREGHEEAASCYIFRSGATGTRTIVNYSDLPDMTVSEFAQRAACFSLDDETWWHFEGRTTNTTLMCIRMVRTILPRARISVEIEKPGREGLAELATEAHVVFYSRAWAESRGHTSPEACLRNESCPRAFLSMCTWGAEGAAALCRPAYQCHRYPVLQQVEVVDAVGAGDTFIAGMLYGLVCHQEDWNTDRKVRLGVNLATRKVQQEGFGGLGVLAASG